MKNQKRIVVLDTETTGMNQGAGSVALGHQIIEIGAVELVNRKLTGRTYHQYIKPDRKIDEEAIKVHGITDDFLEDKPSFSEIASEFCEFIKDAELVIHNAPFDLAFLNQELSQISSSNLPLEQTNEVTDSLAIAKQTFPGKRNNLDALCKRFNVDNSGRDLHGALIDADLLAQVYLLMTGGQISLLSDDHGEEQSESTLSRTVKNKQALNLVVLKATEQEEQEHLEYLEFLQKKSKGNCLWLNRIQEKNN